MPIPLLIVISLLGLFAYAAFGAVVGTFAVYFFDNHANIKTLHAGSYVRGMAGRRYGDEVSWIGFGVAAVFWPILLPCAIVLGGPVWLAFKIGRYIANAMIGDGGNHD